jgi:hypothetical protein
MCVPHGTGGLWFEPNELDIFYVFVLLWYLATPRLHCVRALVASRTVQPKNHRVCDQISHNSVEDSFY